MTKYFNIAIIGAGNVAWHLGPALENAGHKVIALYNRTSKNAQALQQILYHAAINTSLDFSESTAEIFILCVADDAIKSMAQEIVLPDNGILIHTSGSQSIDKLGFAGTKNIGVLYPLQTFTKGKQISFEDIPMLYEAENKHTTKTLKQLGKSISNHAKRVKAQERMAVHIAAVFACNFTNHLFEIAETLLQRSGFDLEILRPLIAETVNKSLDLGPQKAQTGPAARGDLQALDQQLDFLKGSDAQDVYQLISQKILNR